ncbi:Kae1-associated kinase Bud32, partial [Candidatus Bathyarchaeota archaeon]
MLIKKGAEASLYLEDWHGRRVILKKRLAKKYRIPELDREIRAQRTRHEPQIIHKAKEAGVPTPIIYMVDMASSTIVMEYVEGKRLKEILNDLRSEERRRLCHQVG